MLTAVVGVAPAAAAATPKLRVYDATLTEGTGGQAIVAFAVQLSAKAPKAVSFTWRTKASSATTPADFTGVPSGTKATIAKGSISTVLIVRVAADAIDEYSESFGVTISGASGATIATSSATATILDDDAPPVLSLSTAAVVEGTDAAPVARPVTATLSEVSGKPISVRYAVSGDTALIGSDLVGGTATLQFAPGVQSTDFSVDLVGDGTDEATEAFGLTWAGPLNVQLPARVSPRTLLDDDGPLRPAILGSTPLGPSPDPLPLLFGIAPAESTVEVFGNGTCAGTAIATGPAEAFTGAGFAVPMTPNSVNTLSVKGTNTVGGDDTDCSTAFTYRHDDIAPNAPSNLQAVPGTPTQDPAPTLRGTAEAGSTVSVYVDTDCTGTPVSTSTAADFGDADGLPLGALTPNVAHAVRVTATDAAGNVSPCSAAFTVTIDTVGPAAPTGLSVLPATVTNDTTPAVRGTAEAGSAVELFLDTSSPFCTGTPQESGTAADFGDADGITLTPALSEGPHIVHVRAVDAAGNVGTCSDEVTLTIDTVAPGPPTGLALLGGTPTSDRTPAIQGSADAGTTVTLYLDSTPGAGVNCNTEVGSGSASSFGDGNGITLSVDLADGDNLLRATATDDLGQESSCSTSSASVEVDTDGPNAPTGVAVVGGSPTNDRTPALRGTAEPGSTVRVYVDSTDCSSTAVATGTAAEFAAAAGLEVDVQLSSGVHTLHAAATDGLGNQGACTAGAAVTIDFTPPVITGFSRVGPSPTTNVTPSVTGSVSEAGTVDVFGVSTCAGSAEESGSVAEFEAGLTITPALADGSHSFWAQATDLAGNVGACVGAVTVVVDGTPPADPTLLAIVGGSPTGSATFGVRGATDDGTTITIFQGTVGCSQEVATGLASEFTSQQGIEVTLPEGTHTLRAIATDGVGLDSDCSDPVAVEVDLTRPNPPNALSIEPGTPTNDRTPGLRGTAEAGSQVHVFVDNPTCAGVADATGTAATFAQANGIVLLDDLSTGAHTLSATSTDAAGNESFCSAGEAVLIDVADPVVTDFALVGPDPTNDPTPEVIGSVSEAGSVDLYDTGGCSGSPVVSGSVASFEQGLAITPALGDDDYSFWAQATDLAGNVGDCVGPVSVTIDTDPPAAPVIDTIPDGPDTNPRATGTAEADTTVRVYLGGSCTGSPVALGSESSFAAPGLALGPGLGPDTYTVRATAEDAAGNLSGCSAGVTFVVV